jgi:signal transduction histidine kinase
VNILLVDDDEVDRLAVVRALRAAGLNVTLEEAGSVPAAVSALGESVFDCVLLDYHLPGGDGLDVLRTVKGDETGTPVIILTGHGDEQTAVEFMKAGADDYLPKNSLSADRLAQSLRYVTERHQLERQRDESRAREREARAEAEQANAAKDLFLATLSHELRTPLNAILGWARILNQRSMDRNRVRHALGVIERNANVQLQLINDLLDVSRIISGKLELQIGSVDPAKVCDAALDAVRPQIDAKAIVVEKDYDADVRPILGDSARLQQVVWNLLSNAIKFSQTAGVVRLRLRQLVSHVEIVVADDGRGISADFLSHLFDRYTQAAAPDRDSHGGLGLGLAIVRNLVEMHGGSIDAASEGEGRGATFTVLLPMAADSRAADPADRRETAAVGARERLDGIRVLFIDDSADARDLVATILRDRGAKVSTCASTDAALAALARERPDVLISDIEMPGGDGYEMIRALRLRDEDTEAPIPAIALTGATRAEDRIRILAAGFQLHVPKPVNPRELVAAVAALGAPFRRSSSTDRGSKDAGGAARSKK